MKLVVFALEVGRGERWARSFLRNEVSGVKNAVMLLTIVSALSSQILPQILFLSTMAVEDGVGRSDPVHDFLCRKHVGAVAMGVCHWAARFETDILMGAIRFGRRPCLLLMAVRLGD